MKKISLSILAVMFGFATNLLAQTPSGTTFSASPILQDANPGDPFNVVLSLAGTTPPPNIIAYDLYLITDAANAGFFTITGSVPSAPFNGVGPSFLPSPFSEAGAAGFIRNDENLGYSAGAAQTAPYNFTLQTITILIDASTPVGTYTFFTSTVANAGAFYSDVTSNDLNDPNNPYTVGEGQFQIQVVPEPASWSLIALGGVGALGVNLLRARRKS